MWEKTVVASEYLDPQKWEKTVVASEYLDPQSERKP